MFDLFLASYLSEYITLPDGSQHQGSDCPVGLALAPGDSVGWTSDGRYQGNGGAVHVCAQGSTGSGRDNGCAAKGSCGLPHSDYGLGGGWQICFA